MTSTIKKAHTDPLESPLPRWRPPMSIMAWMPLVVLPTGVLLFFPRSWPAWAFMWTLAAALFLGCKWLTWQRTVIRRVPIVRQIGYFLGWPGLDAGRFFQAPSPATLPKPSRTEWIFALSKLVVGLFVVFGLARQVPVEYPYLVGWAGMLGFVMSLHFGFFHLLSCAWRSRGVDAPPLMHWPMAAVSVSDFWGRRWNRAFRDLTHRYVFQPLTKRFGPRGAVIVGFAFSGLLHELVISVPAKGGFGGPTLFFLLQGIAIFVERSHWGKRMGLGTGWRGWLFTMSILLLPIGLLFHRPFVIEVVVPFLQAVRAI